LTKIEPIWAIEGRCATNPKKNLVTHVSAKSASSIKERVAGHAGTKERTPEGRVGEKRFAADDGRKMGKNQPRCQSGEVAVGGGRRGK